MIKTLLFVLSLSASDSEISIVDRNFKERFDQESLFMSKKSCFSSNQATPYSQSEGVSFESKQGTTSGGDQNGTD
jgi:hypothetical protein